MTLVWALTNQAVFLCGVGSSCARVRSALMACLSEQNERVLVIIVVIAIVNIVYARQTGRYWQAGEPRCCTTLPFIQTGD